MWVKRGREEWGMSGLEGDGGGGGGGGRSSVDMRNMSL